LWILGRTSPFRTLVLLSTMVVADPTKPPSLNPKL